jgi:predicted MPP superfamily phosphohydrolase
MRKLMIRISALLLVASVFVTWTYARLGHPAAWAWAALPILLAVGFFPATMLSHRARAPWIRALTVSSGIAVGFLSYLLFAAVATWVALGVVRGFSLPVAPALVGAVAYGLGIVASLVALASGYWLRVTQVTVRLPNLPAFWKGRTLALVSDLHLGNFRGGTFSRQVVAKLMSLGAECILIGGDLFDGVRIDVAKALEPWRALSAPSGVFFVGGNHDDYGGRNSYFAGVRRAGLTVLENERVEVHGLQLAGVHDRETHDPKTYGQILARSGLKPGVASILLAHRPENLEVPAEAGIDLQLSGHTHRGQFWPWTLIARRVHREFSYGLNRFGRMQVFTSSGAGTWGPPFRLGSRSEVVLIRLEPAL